MKGGNGKFSWNINKFLLSSSLHFLLIIIIVHERVLIYNHLNMSFYICLPPHEFTYIFFLSHLSLLLLLTRLHKLSWIHYITLNSLLLLQQHISLIHSLLTLVYNIEPLYIYWHAAPSGSQFHWYNFFYSFWSSPMCHNMLFFRWSHKFFLIINYV